jgi:hypothetical protein
MGKDQFSAADQKSKAKSELGTEVFPFSST